MQNKEKTRVAILYGGRSAEHEVSLVSATNVIMNLDRTLFDVIPIGIDREGTWFLGDDILKHELPASQPMLRLHRDQERMLFNPEFIGKSFPVMIPQSSLLTKSHRLFDVIFPVIHGPLCEDGTVQGLLELADVPYVGCGVLASAMGMDKDVSKRLVQHAGIAVPDFVVVRAGEWLQNQAKCLSTISQQLPYPVFVKPVNTGSSVGVSKVKTPQELTQAIDMAFCYDTKVIIEQGIDAIEIEVAVLESINATEEPFVSIPGEIKPGAGHEFYSYASKYLDENGAELIIPAPLSNDIKEKIHAIAKQIFQILDCEGMARVDFLLERKTNKIYFNEVNSLPGFTTISMYPKLMAASGVPYSQLLTHLIELAMQRHTRKNQLSRHFSQATT
jgi:D-alanine-D-alanine ligase